MSEWNGKGSWSRVTNYKNYWDSELWNNKNKGKPKKYLFLDDVRKVGEAVVWDSNSHLLELSRTLEYNWDIVRSYDEFVNYIEENGIPDVVSFDNDLWDVSKEMAINPKNEELIKQFQMIGWQDFRIKTGAHCAEYLVNACKARKVPIPEYYIHSANSAARPIIREILESARNNK